MARAECPFDDRDGTALEPARARSVAPIRLEGRQGVQRHRHDRMRAPEEARLPLERPGIEAAGLGAWTVRREDRGAGCST